MYGTKKARVSRIEAAPASGRGHRDRPLALGLVRPIVLVRPAARRVPRASPRPAEPAAPRGRLAGLGLRGRARGGQDAGRGLLDPAPRRGRHHEARLPDRPDHGRYPRRHGRGPLGAARGRAPLVPASIRAFETPRDLAQRCPRGLLERRRARARPRVEHRHPLGRRAGVLAARRIDLGHGDAGTAGRHQSPGPDHDNTAPRRGPADASSPRRPPSRRPIPPMPTRPTCRREFIAQIIGLYENTRLGRQEIHAEFLDTTEGVWFTRFDPARHVSIQAEYDSIYHVRCAIDAGTSRHTAAVFFQVRHNNGVGPPRVTVFGDYHALDVVSRKNALAIKELADRLPCHGKIDCVRLDPAATARSSLGPGGLSPSTSRCSARGSSPGGRSHLVLDGLETLDLLLESGNLLIHPRCTRLKDAFQTYSRQRRGGEWIDYPADGHPEEDLIDALRGGIRDAFPEGLAPRPNLRPVHAGRVL